MTEVKIYRVKGIISSPNYKTTFSKDVRAIKPEYALEKIYVELGSKHKVKRIHMKITSINEVSEDDTRDLLIKALSKW